MGPTGTNGATGPTGPVGATGENVFLKFSGLAHNGTFFLADQGIQVSAMGSPVEYPFHQPTSFTRMIARLQSFIADGATLEVHLRKATVTVVTLSFTGFAPAGSQIAATFPAETFDSSNSMSMEVVSSGLSEDVGVAVTVQT